MCLQKILESTKQIDADGIYISLALSEKSKTKLKKYLLENNIKESFNDFHCTIIYSKKKFSGKIISDFEEIIVEKTSLGRFENKEKDENVVVLHLDNPKINSLHNFYMQNYDFKYDFPDYQPHMTLTYFGKEINLEDLNDLDFPLIFDKLEIEKLDDNYVEKIKKD